MGEFLQNYGLWILLIGIFFAMHRFGMGCGGHGGHRHGDEQKDSNKKPETAGGHQHGTSGEAPAAAGRRAGGCH
jgi:hypothetical protein